MSKKLDRVRFDAERSMLEEIMLDGDISIPEYTKKLKDLAKKYNIKIQFGK